MFCVSQKTNIAPENGPSQKDILSSNRWIFSGYVSISEGTTPKSINDYTGWIFTQ